MDRPLDVRVLGPQDLSAMRRLLAVFGEAFEDAETYGGQPPTDAYLAGLLASPAFVAIAAFDGPAEMAGVAEWLRERIFRAKRQTAEPGQKS